MSMRHDCPQVTFRYKNILKRLIARVDPTDIFSAIGEGQRAFRHGKSVDQLIRRDDSQARDKEEIWTI